MAQLKQHMYQHLRSAKEWLTKAEDAFAKQHDIRAELDLMLAQAELRHATEANRSRQWRYRYVIFRHGLALTLAIFMAIGVGGVYWWTTRPVLDVAIPLGVQANVPVEAGLKLEEMIIPRTIPITMGAEKNIPVEHVTKERETVRSSSVASQASQASQAEQPRYQAPVVLSDDEVQKLVRAAGKTLRGQ